MDFETAKPGKVFENVYKFYNNIETTGNSSLRRHLELTGYVNLSLEMFQRDKLVKSNGLYKDLSRSDFANVHLRMGKTCADNYLRCFRLVEEYPRLQNLNCSFTMLSKNAVAITSLFKMDAEYAARWR